jgi:hypothetical protein
MSCSHVPDCPLFPLLNESLRGWRSYYCNSDQRWHDCARYRMAARGELVPISLLPNGVDAGHIRTASERAAHSDPTRAQQPVHGAESTVFEAAPRPPLPAEPAFDEPTPRPPSDAQSSSPPAAAPAERTQVMPQRAATAHPWRERLQHWWIQLSTWLGEPA